MDPLMDHWELYTLDGNFRLHLEEGDRVIDKLVAGDPQFITFTDIFGDEAVLRNSMIMGLARVSKDTRQAQWEFDERYTQLKDQYIKENFKERSWD